MKTDLVGARVLKAGAVLGAMGLAAIVALVTSGARARPRRRSQASTSTISCWKTSTASAESSTIISTTRLWC